MVLWRKFPGGSIKYPYVPLTSDNQHRIHLLLPCPRALAHEVYEVCSKTEFNEIRVVQIGKASARHGGPHQGLETDPT
jgi:hypothetical protein